MKTLKSCNIPDTGGSYDDNSEAPARGNYFPEIAKYLCGFTDAHTHRYIHLKNFEIASVGSLLLTDRLVEKEMNELGFVDYETCIFCDQGTFLEKVSWILDEENRPAVDKIRHAGMELVRRRHMTGHRAAQISELIEGLDLASRAGKPARHGTQFPFPLLRRETKRNMNLLPTGLLFTFPPGRN